ncbi:unnamed protein product [Spirodela intermedia]|uniref:Uncharacterized protein n=1 Tax=Spirodela intermedia TaxID=51605 RepID=A0A7I8IPB0_SPIIN|nr:unnamed protein product [Spirodela intermedia]CAA6659737.1 unnamed protein product [Spirodela intermedia]
MEIYLWPWNFGSSCSLPKKRIGHLPGICCMAEMVALGLHSHWLNGIDYMGVPYGKMAEYSEYSFPLAICIVLSGMYEDDLDNSEDIIYTGQGGHDLLGNKRQIKDQKMERGNLALKNSMLHDVPVRVVRGHESASSYCGKVYTYDGLYKVHKYWAEKGVSGFTVFKYQLKRLKGQPALTTNQVIWSVMPESKYPRQSRKTGQENFPIPATNIVDDACFPPPGKCSYRYSKSIQVAKGLKLPRNAHGCKCKGDCINPRLCACARFNGLDFPYVRRNVVFECGPSCSCQPGCANRISQQGLKYHLEVFRTLDKGWAVRSWDTIPSGAPVCEYTGIIRRTDDMENVSENNFIFEIDCLQTMKKRPGDVSFIMDVDEKKLENPEFCIDAGSIGNVARFINHSCEPNLFVQCILSWHHDIRLAKIMLFAELTYDYGYALDSVVGPDGRIKQMECRCGPQSAEGACTKAEDRRTHSIVEEQGF